MRVTKLASFDLCKKLGGFGGTLESKPIDRIKKIVITTDLVWCYSLNELK